MQVPVAASKLLFISCALRLLLEEMLTTIFWEEGSTIIFVLLCAAGAGAGAEGKDYVPDQPHKLQKLYRTVIFETGCFRCAGSDFDHTS
jgi:hypothetical protein